MARDEHGALPLLVKSALGLLLAGMLSCSPRASTVPLGLGPLAVAERDAQAERETARRAKRAKPARRSPVAAAPQKEPIAKAEAAKVEEKKGSGDGDESADPAISAAPVRFAGMYAGEDVAVFRLTGFPEQEQRDDKAKIRIEDAAAGNVSIVLINSTDGSDLCELTARVEGNAALIETAQPCFTGGAEGAPEAELTSGRAVLDGDQLRMEAEGTLSVPDQDLDGDLTYSFEGERQ